MGRTLCHVPIFYIVDVIYYSPRTNAKSETHTQFASFALGPINDKWQSHNQQPVSRGDRLTTLAAVSPRKQEFGKRPGSPMGLEVERSGRSTGNSLNSRLDCWSPSCPK